MTPSRSRLLAGLASAAIVGLLATGLGAPTASAAGRDARDQARAALAAHPAALRTSPEDSFAARGATVLDKDGSAHVRYDRSYRGLPVLGGDVVVHLTEDGSYDGSSVTLQRPLTARPGRQGLQGGRHRHRDPGLRGHRVLDRGPARGRRDRLLGRPRPRRSR